MQLVIFGNRNTSQNLIPKSAYDIWKERGNSGSEQVFLDSLKGADGGGNLFIQDTAPTPTKFPALWIQTNVNGNPDSYEFNIITE